jgi:hypothetical protein
VLRIVNLEEIEGMLLRVPALVRELDERNPEFIFHVKDWLSQTEQALANNRLAAAGGVAALRGELISAERGAIPAGVEISGRRTSRKLKAASASHVIRLAHELVVGAVAGDATRIAEAERLMGQIVSVARAKGVIPADMNGGDHGARLRVLWQEICSDPDTGAAATRVNGLVGMSDSLIVLDRMLATAR